ncbi:TPA: hypothetical protein N0F65_000141 [Lagenidium giganteum]|uniref:Uncharacterized protein n=1 Tax=Lagenidium giganteum TaxID=4803 RepID=A0AAV2YZ53_9STRA|nr:TPA: hypothetical protein N0F65_000141 [Lagenidium giganteum]
MGKARTQRKNRQKRTKRRIYAAINAEICDHVRADRCDDGSRTWLSAHGGAQQEEALQAPEQREQVAMEQEKERQRTHERWVKANAVADAQFKRKQRILQERKRLIEAIRQVRVCMML